MHDMTEHNGSLRIGWAQTDLTPPEPVLIAGQFRARVSEGVADPVTATALALDDGTDHAVLVSCDLVAIGEELLAAVRETAKTVQGLDPRKLVLHATHTHTGPVTRLNAYAYADGPDTTDGPGIELGAYPNRRVLAFLAARIAEAVANAWAARANGRIAFGLGHAVIGHNRRWVMTDGRAVMYGNTDCPEFSHIEGSEDHSLGVLATRDANGRLTGLIVNVACSSQVSENDCTISADYWHETRRELRRRLGADLFVAAQCSAAGDQSPHLLYDKTPEQRMLQRAGRTQREELALRVAEAVERVLSILGQRDDLHAPLLHRVETLALPLNPLTAEQVQAARTEAGKWQERYETLLQKVQTDPARREQPRWYVELTSAQQHMLRHQRVVQASEKQPEDARCPCELHVIRLGEIVFATNPFEYYLDHGIHIKARSRATQTFLIQLAGTGSYVPSLRSTRGGGYGSVPGSNRVGPDGGRKLAEWTVRTIAELFGT